jgi:hypothetical protein
MYFYCLNKLIALRRQCSEREINQFISSRSDSKHWGQLCEINSGSVCDGTWVGCTETVLDSAVVTLVIVIKYQDMCSPSGLGYNFLGSVHWRFAAVGLAFVLLTRTD